MNALNRVAAILALSWPMFVSASVASTAWVSSSDEGNEHFHHVAHVNSTDGEALLVVGCHDSREYTPLHLVIHTGEDHEATTAPPRMRPVTIVSGGKTVTFSAAFHNNGGKLMIEANEARSRPVGTAINALQMRTEFIEVTYLQTRLTFPAANADKAVRHVVDRCW